MIISLISNSSKWTYLKVKEQLDYLLTINSEDILITHGDSNFHRHIQRYTKSKGAEFQVLYTSENNNIKKIKQEIFSRCDWLLVFIKQVVRYDIEKNIILQAKKLNKPSFVVSNVNVKDFKI